MEELKATEGRITICMRPVVIGDDLCVIIYGGERPHIGCVTLSVPRPSLADPAKTSSTTSVMNLIGHKDDEAATYVSGKLSAALNKNVVTTCGIHVKNITKDEIDVVMKLVKRMTEQLLHMLQNEQRMA